jgi:hypothetical protein
MRIQFENLNFTIRSIITNNLLPIVIEINKEVRFFSEVENNYK